jgi:predicted nucleic acid-binding protein
MKIYLDTNVVSLRGARIPSGTTGAHQWAATYALWELLYRLHIRPITSSVTVEEARKGHKGAVRKRATVLRSATIVRETAPMRQIANKIEACLPKQPHLAGDIRHYAAAWHIGASRLVTWNVGHFEEIAAAAPPTLSTENPPEILTPLEAIASLARLPRANPKALRLSPFVRKLIDEETRAGIALARRDGFFDLSAKIRKHPEQREHLLRTHRFITGKKA